LYYVTVIPCNIEVEQLCPSDLCESLMGSGISSVKITLMLQKTWQSTWY